MSVLFSVVDAKLEIESIDGNGGFIFSDKLGDFCATEWVDRRGG
jgi:hypothetical protein